LIIITHLFILLDQIPLLFPLFFMFASSSLLSGYRKKDKEVIEKVVGKSGPRDYIQAIANLGAASLFMLLYNFFQNDLWLAGLIGSVAGSNADSWASEIGCLSKKQPVSIIDLKPMSKGISGGITLLGSLAGLAGSIFISVVSVITMICFNTIQISIPAFLIAATAAGFMGMLSDSLAGATFQALYQEKNSDALTEHPEGNRLVKGIPWINNDAVNFIGSLFAGCISIAIYKILISI
jgi:uncharacterized protein (TIGR00297 family)